MSKVILKLPFVDFSIAIFEYAESVFHIVLKLALILVNNITLFQNN